MCGGIYWDLCQDSSTAVTENGQRFEVVCTDFCIKLILSKKSNQFCQPSMNTDILDPKRYLNVVLMLNPME